MNALIRCRERRQASVQKEITNEWTVLNINILNASHKVPVREGLTKKKSLFFWILPKLPPPRPPPNLDNLYNFF